MYEYFGNKITGYKNKYKTNNWYYQKLVPDGDTKAIFFVTNMSTS
ncbi:hypothetical protein PESP_a0656 [Pseudoalteromonas espejiana DSM 9414]|nr:hypothetical protein PESP_a0656 [Pseudoalteromonas espejiana DSM 9414]